MSTFAVFSDRCNVTVRHVDGLTEPQAMAKAIQLTEVYQWPCYAAPSDFNPYEGYPDWSDIPEEEWPDE